MDDTPLVALKLDAFTYQQFADGRTMISGADGKPLSAGLYAIDFCGRETIVSVQAPAAAKSGGFVEAELRREAERARGRTPPQ